MDSRKFVDLYHAASVIIELLGNSNITDAEMQSLYGITISHECRMVY